MNLCQLHNSDQAFVQDKVLCLSGLSLIRNHLVQYKRCNVLDLGPPVNNNIEYFREFNCRIQIQNLYQELIDNPRYQSMLYGNDSELNDQDIGQLFDKLLSDCHGIHYDLILFWELIDYFHQRTLKALMGSLAAHCKRKTHLYMVSSTNQFIPSVASRFSLLGDNQTRYQPFSSKLIDGPRYNVRAIERILPGFHLVRSFLLPEGLQEYIWEKSD